MKRGFLKNKKLAPVTTNEGDQTATFNKPETVMRESVPVVDHSERGTMEKGFLKNKTLTRTTNDDRDQITTSNYRVETLKDRSHVVEKSSMDGRSAKPESAKEECKLSTQTQKTNAGKMEFVKCDPRTADYPVGQPVIATIPLRYPYQTVAIGANGWAECILKDGKLKQEILSIPGFPHSVPHFDPPRYRIGPSEHGTGMFATCDIDQGELILAERPVLVMIRGFPVPLDLSRKMQLAQIEGVLEMCVERMLPQNRKAFFELFIGPENVEDVGGPIFRRMGINGIGITLGEGEEVHSGTFVAAARMNHSCIANVSYRFDQASFSLRVHAVRSIKAGEEIFVSYLDSTLPRSERKRLLRGYGFECTCPACGDPTYDQRISLMNQNSDPNNISPLLVGRAQSMLNDSLHWLKTIEEMKAQAHGPYFIHIVRVARAASALGKKEMAKKYKALAQKMQFLVTDPMADVWETTDEYFSRLYNIPL